MKTCVIRGWVKMHCIIKIFFWCFTSYTVTLWYYKASITTLITFLSCTLFKSFIDFHESFWHEWSVKKSRSKRQVWLNIWTLSAGRIRWPNSSSTAQISGRASVHALRAPLRQQTILTTCSVTHTHTHAHISQDFYGPIQLQYTLWREVHAHPCYQHMQ